MHFSTVQKMGHKTGNSQSEQKKNEELHFLIKKK